MSEVVHRTPHVRHAADTAQPAPGAAWFGAMVALWSIFFTLLVVSPETLDDVYAWLTSLAIVWEILMWIVLLPWAVAHVVLESSWAQWLQVALVVLIATVHIAVSQPRSGS